MQGLRVPNLLERRRTSSDPLARRNSSYLKGALIDSDIGLFASEAMQPLVAYILSMRHQWPLEWVWATPITSLVLFGGPHMGMVSCSILVSRRAESHRQVTTKNTTKLSNATCSPATNLAHYQIWESDLWPRQGNILRSFRTWSHRG